MGDITTIQITAETWQELNRRKRPGDTFDDVIQRILGDDETDTGDETPRQPDTETADHAVDERIRGIVADVSASWDDTPDRLAARKAAAEAALRLAVERGSMSRKEAVRDVRPDHGVDGQNETTWWRKNVRPVLQEVGDHAPSRGYSVSLDDHE